MMIVAPNYPDAVEVPWYVSGGPDSPTDSTWLLGASVAPPVSSTTASPLMSSWLPSPSSSALSFEYAVGLVVVLPIHDHRSFHGDRRINDVEIDCLSSSVSSW
jgi:hypothetical protein